MPTSKNAAKQKSRGRDDIAIGYVKVTGRVLRGEECTTTVETPCFRLRTFVQLCLNRDDIEDFQITQLIANIISVDADDSLIKRMQLNPNDFVVADVIELSDGKTPAPTVVTSWQSSTSPSKMPSTISSLPPSSGPSQMDADLPYERPSTLPSESPSTLPSESPSTLSSEIPSTFSSESPSTQPSYFPSLLPTSNPTRVSTLSPAMNPTKSQTSSPTQSPTLSPTLSPTTPGPSWTPTRVPTTAPTENPTSAPTSGPTLVPTPAPTFPMVVVSLPPFLLAPCPGEAPLPPLPPTADEYCLAVSQPCTGNVESVQCVANTNNKNTGPTFVGVVIDQVLNTLSVLATSPIRVVGNHIRIFGRIWTNGRVRG